MQTLLRAWFVVVMFMAAVTAAFAQAGTCSGMSLGQGANLNGFVPFPASSLWNTDISTAPVDPNSANIINFIGSTVTLHPDFGAGTFHNQTIGIPYQVEAGSQPKVNVRLGTFASESDPGPMPIPSNALIEGYPKPGNGDRHVLVLEKDGWNQCLDPQGCTLFPFRGGWLVKGGKTSSGERPITNEPTISFRINDMDFQIVLYFRFELVAVEVRCAQGRPVGALRSK